MAAKKKPAKFPLLLRPKLPLMAHQEDAARFMAERKFYALLMEQGTGKTAVEIYDSANRFAAGEIDVVIVVAPNGVQTNWVLNELPKHMPDGVRWKAYEFDSRKTKANEKAQAKICSADDGDLRIVLVNYEALLTRSAMDFLERFTGSMTVGMKLISDESHRIKNPSSGTTKAINTLRRSARVASILSGTPILNSPWDAFSQFNFLASGILETTSYSVFRSQYAELLPPSHGVLRHIAERRRPELMRRFRNNTEKVEEYLKKYAPQVPARDTVTGLPKWRNLERLASLIAPHAFRVRKVDCLTLPPKIYTQIVFHMTAAQAKVYSKAEEEFRLWLEKEQYEQPVARIAMITKLSQITSGFFILRSPDNPGESDVHQLFSDPLDNPKNQILLQELETCLGENQEQVIIWARFHEELDSISRILTAKGISHVQYHGRIGKEERIAGMKAFKEGSAQVFLAQQEAGGTGLTLIAEKSIAKTMSVIYYSNSWRYGDRAQSEDRAHRIGQEKSVRYVDIAAIDSIDMRVINSLRNKEDIASIVTGDKARVAENVLNFDR